MKKILALLFIALLPVIGYGQNLQRLAADNGFKCFKFGTPFDSLKHTLESAEPAKVVEATKEKTYFVKSDTAYTVFRGVQVELLALEFQDNKLVSVGGSLKDGRTFYGMLSKLREVYGMDKEEGKNRFTWMHEGYYLSLSSFSEDGSGHFYFRFQ